MDKKTEAIRVNVTAEQKLQLEEIARGEDRSVANIVRLAIERYLKEYR